MKASISFSKESLIKAFKLHYNTKHPISSRLMLIVGVLILLIGFLFFYIDFPTQPEFFKHLIVLVGFAYIALFFYRRKKLYERASSQKTFQGEFTFDINKKGISFGKDDKASRCGWDEIIEIIEDKETILFYFGKSKFYILPINQLNASQKKDARETINKNYGK